MINGTSRSNDRSGSYLLVLSLAALGVVFGDIGTSPLYAIGFMEDPDVPSVLAGLKVPGLRLEQDDLIFFLAREKLFATHKPGMAIWREKLFVWMSRNALGATTFFRIPPSRVVELGQQVEL